MNEIRNRIADQDQVIRTYFVRVIETFGVFVGIFAVVVVIIGDISSTLVGAGPELVAIIMIGVPVTVVLAILAMLWGIKRLMLTAPK